MKKMIIGMIAAVIAQVAFCDVTPALVSENLFGSIKVSSITIDPDKEGDNLREYAMVAVPFEGFASSFDFYDVEVRPNTILACDVVSVDRLQDGDIMSIFNPNLLPDANGQIDRTKEFDTYVANWNKRYHVMLWDAVGWFDVEKMSYFTYTDPEERYVEVGTGVFVGREAQSQIQKYDVYAFGQIPSAFPYDEYITLKKGKNMLSAPGEMAYKDVNINKSLEWSGTINPVQGLVDDLSQFIDDEYSEEDLKADFGIPEECTSLDYLSITSWPDNADIIAYYDLKSQKEVQMVYFDGSWFRLIDAVSGIRDDKAVVLTAGQSFWFVKGGDSELKVRWKNPASQISVGDHD